MIKTLVKEKNKEGKIPKVAEENAARQCIKG